MDKRAQDIISFWLGKVEQTLLPSDKRAIVWFGAFEFVDNDIKTKFSDDLKKAIDGKCEDWKNDPHGCFALVLIFDQFSRRIYRGDKRAFDTDEKALDLCLNSIEKQFDHELSLIERAFFYFPLLHAENLKMQSISVHAYQVLLDLSLPETRTLFRSFWDFSIQQYNVIKRFGRFPERNDMLGRNSTRDELDYLSTLQAQIQQIHDDDLNER